MIRNIFITLIFFGPALLMFVLRHFFLLVKVWLTIRKHRQQDQVIDITPHPAKTSPGKLFITVSLLVGLTCAVWVWMEMQHPPQPDMRYVPAYTDSNGNIVPGHYEPVPYPSQSEKPAER